MTFGNELVRIRRLLRDPNGNIWDTDLLRELWNAVQHDVQIKTSILEDVTVLAVPPRFKFSYMHDWERSHTDKGSFRCLFNQDGHFAFSYPDEVQQNFGIAGDTTQGGSTGTHPFEAWFQTPGRLPPIPFPANFHSTKGFYYDEEPIEFEERKTIARRDPSWRSRVGRVISYTRESAETNQFILYPKPSTVTWDDISGTGMALLVDGDTLDGVEFEAANLALLAGNLVLEDGAGELLLESGDTLILEVLASGAGIITQRTGNLLSSESGIATEVLDTEDNVLLVYNVTPTEVEGTGDDFDFPDFLTKYVRYGVLSRAFNANTDGYIPSLANYWNQRYQLGIQAIKRFRSNKTRDRNRTFVSENLSARRTIRHPRLPDGYPAQ